MVHKDRENLTMYNFYFPFYGPAHEKEGDEGKEMSSDASLRFVPCQPRLVTEKLFLHTEPSRGEPAAVSSFLCLCPDSRYHGHRQQDKEKSQKE